jgi:hypothetical protein
MYVTAEAEPHPEMSKGGRKRRVTDEEILDLFREADDPVLSTADVAGKLPIGRRGTLDRLGNLVEEGRLEGKDIGGRNRVWWLPELSDALAVVRERAERADAGGQPPGSSSEEPAPEPSTGAGLKESNESIESDIESLVDEIASDVLPGSGEKLEARCEALHAVVDYLREHGEATPKEFREAIYPDHPAFYTSGDDPAYSWWMNAMYDGLKALSERSERVIAADSSGVWTWRDP